MNPILLRQECTVAFPANGIRIQPSFSFSLPESVSLKSLASSVKNEGRIGWEINLYQARLSKNFYAFRTPEEQKALNDVIGYPEPFTSPLVWMYVLPSAVPRSRLRDYFDARAGRWLHLDDYNRLEESIDTRRIR